MSLNIDKQQSSKKAPRIEEGTYMGRFSSVIDLGVQPQTDWQTGEAVDSKPRVLITMTLPTETVERELDDGTVDTYARLISKEYTISGHERANLTKLAAAMKIGGDLSELLGTECMVSIGSTVNGNAKVTNIVKAPAGLPIPELENEAYAFDFDAPEEAVFLSMPEWIQGKIKDADNYSGFADSWVKDEAQAA